MTSVTICPGCQRQVIVPAETSDTALVACPLCEEQFVLSGSIPADAPVLQIMDAGIESEATALEPDRGESIATEEAAQEMVTSEEAGSELEMTDSIGTEEPAEELATPEEEMGLGGPLSDLEPQEDEISFAPDEVGEGDQAPTFFSEQEAMAEGDQEGDLIAATPAKPALRAKKKKKIGIKTHIAGIVIFGVVGLGLGYGILKVVKPAAAKPFDEMIAKAWEPLSSLWSSTESASGQAATAAAPAAEGDGFQPGGMLPEDQQPTEEDLAEMIDTADSAADLASTDSQTGGEASGDGWGDGDGLFELPGDDQPAAGFAALLNGQPDEAGVIESIDLAALQDAVDRARSLNDDDDGKLEGSFYLGLCDLGHTVAFAPRDEQAAAELSRTEATDLIRQVSPPQMQARLEGFAIDMLYSEKRPRDKKGIFLVGKTQIIKRFGNLFATEIEIRKLPKEPNRKTVKRVVVLSEARPQLKVDQMAGVLGVVVRDPQAKLPGYDRSNEAFADFQADDTLVVLAGVVTQLPKR
ncbi:MAG: hypothetical protein GTO53_12925 [Planctomycetales bacterium]|nr:hypothetical protein [Planctomycetales bacterium]NIM10003.1 hypothetical protein [Planctomycetales bacterium]NIN09443.1 hypothetical protein [Planctomycetales bacterium]NIN78552.1 hypothetical protein [Planctomycetales bacterium]NIO35744.1 hypothetical protein [Planctomycetales bacterium]